MKVLIASMSLGVVAGLFTSPRLAAQTTEVAFIANAEGATVTLFDVASKSVVGSIDINPKRAKAEGAGRPNYSQDSDASPDGKTIYVSRGYLGDVAAFDVASGKMRWETPLTTGRSDHMTITADGKYLFVSAIYDNRVYKLSTATGKIEGHVVTGVYPHDVKVSKDGKWIYNSSLGPLGTPPKPINPSVLNDKPGFPMQLTIADATSLKVKEAVRLESAFRPWQFAADEKTIFAQISNDHSVVKYDVATNKVVKRLQLPIKPGVTVADWDFEAPHHGLALTEDGTTLCLAGRASDYAALVDAATLTLIATIPVGDAPGWAEVSHDGNYCLVANTRSDDLSVISIRDRKEVARLPVGDGPKHITMAKVSNGAIAAVKARSARQ